MKFEFISGTFSKKEVFRFLVVGSLAVLLDFLIYFLLIHVSFGHFFAKTTSFLIGTLLVYSSNKYWTFEKMEKSNKEIVLFYILYISTLVVNVSVNQLSLLVFSGNTVVYLFISTGSSTILNFIGQKWWVFAKKVKM